MFYIVRTGSGASSQESPSSPSWDEGNTPEERMFYSIAVVINTGESPKQLLQRCVHVYVLYVCVLYVCVLCVCVCVCVMCVTTLSFFVYRYHELSQKPSVSQCIPNINEYDNHTHT